MMLSQVGPVHLLLMLYTGCKLLYRETCNRVTEYLQNVHAGKFVILSRAEEDTNNVKLKKQTGKVTNHVLMFF